MRLLDEWKTVLSTEKEVQFPLIHSGWISANPHIRHCVTQVSFKGKQTNKPSELGQIGQSEEPPLLQWTLLHWECTHHWYKPAGPPDMKCEDAGLTALYSDLSHDKPLGCSVSAHSLSLPRSVSLACSKKCLYGCMWWCPLWEPRLLQVELLRL